ncbi:hypothetical protein [Kutzneria sp. NPDC052558]|uniref:DUF7847 domain-containing protein n=1 Tax=Kutzneria sp. NPDC052558 TaxID=3364121 RepID=UPI0037CA7EBD
MSDNPEQYIHYPQQPPPAGPLGPPQGPTEPMYYQAPQPGVVPLRPLDVGSLIGGSFKAIFRNWQPALLLPFIASLVTAAIGIVPAFILFSQTLANVNGRTTPDQALSFLGGWLLIMVIELVLVIAVSVTTQAVVTITVSRAVLGRSTTIGQALRAAAPRLLPLLGLTTLIWLIVAGCAFVPFAALVALAVAAQAPGLALLAFLVLVAGIVAGAYFWVSYAFAPAALVMEPAPVLTALRRSRWLVTDNWWRSFGILLLCGVMVYIASYLVELPVSLAQFGQLAQYSTMGGRPDPAQVFGALFSPTTAILITVGSAVVYALGQAFMIGVSTLLYHDLRIRKESFHLALWQMSQLPDDLSPGATATPHPEATI